MDQVSMLAVVRKCLPKLLGYPQTAGMPGHAEVQNTTTAVTDDEEAVQHAKPKGWNSEEIHCGNGFTVVFEKCLPESGGCGMFGNFLHPAGNGSFRDIESQFQELAVDVGCTPCGILGDHLKNEFAHFPADVLSANVVARTPTPISPKSCPVPTHDCFGSDHNQRILPVRPNSRDSNPEKSVERREPRSLLALFED